MPTVPPPPPQPFLTPTTLKNNPINQNISKLELSECMWAIGDRDVQRACFFARTCRVGSPKECVYLKVSPILQTGPTCGLCALSMLYRGTPTTKDLLLSAVSYRYSNNGEMFSVKWLLEVLKNNLDISSINPDKTRSYIYEGQLDSDFIKEKLRSHCMLLVPYDADRNHSPCNQNGHKAHWCLVVGYLVEEDNEFHVFARHGKTRNLGLFSLRDLSDSNGNLNEFSQPAWHPDDIFMLPEGGMRGELGLKNKSIVVEGWQKEVVKVV